MKKLFAIALVALLGVSAVTAQTPEEQASADRIEKLKTEVAQECGVEQIDQLVVKCKSIAKTTVGVDELKKTLKKEGHLTAEQKTGLKDKLQHATTELKEAGSMLGGATTALKGIKNPLKMKSALKSINYAKDVIAHAGEELTHQGKEVASVVAEK